MSSGGEETELNFNFHDSDIGGLEKQVTSSHCGRTVDIPLDNDRSATQNLKKKEKEVQAKEADLRRREQEVKRREDAAAQDTFAYKTGITIEVKNWPPLFLFISKGYSMSPLQRIWVCILYYSYDKQSYFLKFSFFSALICSTDTFMMWFLFGSVGPFSILEYYCHYYSLDQRRSKWRLSRTL